LHRLEIDIGPTDLGALDTYSIGVLDYLLSIIGQIYANILKAIPVSTGIKDSVSFYAYSFLGMNGTACKSVIHSKHLQRFRSKWLLP
jgi:hypothetical protein